MMSHARWMLLVLCLSSVLVHRPARAQSLIEREDVLRALRTLETRGRSGGGEAQWLALRSALDSLSPQEQHQWLKRLVKRAGNSGLSHRLRRAIGRHQPRQVSTSRPGIQPIWWTALPSGRGGMDLEQALSYLGSADVAGHRWAPQELMTDGAALSFGPAFADEAQVFVAGARIAVPRTRRLMLWMGGVGDLVIHLDGREIGRTHGLAFVEPDQFSLPVDLTRGDHVLAVTMVVPPGVQPALHVRWSDRAGRVVDSVGQSSPPSLSGFVGISRGAEDLPGEVMMWTAGIDHGADAPRDVLLRAVARRALGIPDAGGDSDETWPALERAVSKGGQAGVESWLLVLALQHIPRPEDRATILDQLISIRPGDPLLVSNRAQLALDRDRLMAAEQLLTTVKPSRRGFVWRLVGSRLARVRGRLKRALELLAEPAEAGSQRALTERAAVLMEMGQPHRAVDLLEPLVRQLPGAAALGIGLVEALRASGRSADGLDVLETLASREPHVPSYGLEAARLARHLGARDRALNLTHRARARSWAEAPMLRSVAELYELLGEDKAAADTWDRAVELSPSDVSVRTEWERTRSSEEEPLPFEVSPDEARGWTVVQTASEPYTVLSDETHVHLHGDGSLTRFEQLVLRVHQVPEARADRQVVIPFEPDRDQVQVLRAGLYRGELWLKNMDREVYEITEDEIGLYYDHRQMVVSFDDLVVGDTVVIRYRVQQERGAAGFGWIGLLQGPYPKRRIVVTVRAPESTPLRSRLTPPAGQAPPTLSISESRRGDQGHTVLRLEGADLPPVPQEPIGPPVAELSPIWQVSSLRSWDDVATGYERLLRPQRVLTSEMRAWVRDHVARVIREDGSTPRMLLLESMVTDLVRDIRYVGLEFGVHGVVPYRSDQVWSRRFGDCKDQALLMAVLLEEAGFNAQVTLVRTAGRGRLVDPLPSLTFFDHAVVYLSDLDMYVDPTARYFGLGTLPPADQGGQALRIGSGGSSDLTEIPMDTAPKNLVVGDYTIVVDSEGHADVSGSVTFRGILAAQRRAVLQDQGARAHQVELMLNQRYTGLTMSSFQLEALEDRERPLSISFAGQTSWIAKRDRDLLQVVNPAGLSESAPHLASLRARRSDLVLGVPAAVQSRTRYLVPSEWRLSQLPEGGEGQSEFGSWSIHWYEEPGAVVVDARLAYKASRVPPERYSDLRAFLRNLDEHLRAPLVWVSEPSGGQP